MNFQSMHKQRKFILVATAVGVISIFLPWRTISAGLFGVGMSEGINGFRDVGILAFFSFAAAVFALIGIQSSPLEKNMWLGANGSGCPHLRPG